MTDILTIAPAITTIEVAGAKMEMRGLPLRKFTALIGKYPEFSALVSRKAGHGVDIEKMLGSAPDAALALVSAGVSDPKMATIFEDLALREQVEIITRILKLTMPDQPSPFVAAPAALPPESSSHVNGSGAVAENAAMETSNANSLLESIS